MQHAHAHACTHSCVQPAVTQPLAHLGDPDGDQIKNVWSQTGTAVVASTHTLWDEFELKVQDEDPTGGFAYLNAHGMQHAEKITSDEAGWLAKILYSDGEIDANERALLDFIREECPAIDDGLKQILQAA